MFRLVFDRLPGEQGDVGGLEIVTVDMVCLRHQQHNVFVSLPHDPVHAQADFDEALTLIG